MPLSLVGVSVCTQRHDFTNLLALASMDTRTPLNTPLVAIVDFAGFRVTVVSKLHFSDETLAFGLSCPASNIDAVRGGLLTRCAVVALRGVNEQRR
jgi:hypothetical protein